MEICSTTNGTSETELVDESTDGISTLAETGGVDWCDESSHRTSPDTTHHFSLQNPPRDLFDRESEERRDPTCRWEDRSTLVFTRCSHIHRLHQCFLLFLRPFSMCLHGGRKIMQVVLVRVEGNLVPQTTTILLPSGIRFGIVAILQRDLRLLVRGLLDRSY